MTPPWGFTGVAPLICPGHNCLKDVHVQGLCVLLSESAVLDHVLSQRRYAAGDDYTIADIAHFGWFWRREYANASFDEVPHVARWYDAVAARPAVQRAIQRVEALVP